MSTNNFKPNTILPKDAKKVKRFEATFGCWVQMKFDAKLRCHNIDWYRVYKGFSGENKSEDWIADVPGVGTSVHEYHWNGDSFSKDYGTIQNAMKEELERGLQAVKNCYKETQVKLDFYSRGIETLKAAGVKDVHK